VRPPSRARCARPPLLRDLSDLFKVRIASFVGLSAWVGALLVARRAAVAGLRGLGVDHALRRGRQRVHQVLERGQRQRMERTRTGPLPAGRIAKRRRAARRRRDGGGRGRMLAWRLTLLSALLTLGTLFAYVAVYNAAQRAPHAEHAGGAVPGAAPPLLGYVPLSPGAPRAGWALFRRDLRVAVPAFWRSRAVPRGHRRPALRMLPAERGRGAARPAARRSVQARSCDRDADAGPVAPGGPVFTLGATVWRARVPGASGASLDQERSSARLLLFTRSSTCPSCSCWPSPTRRRARCTPSASRGTPWPRPVPRPPRRPSAGLLVIGIAGVLSRGAGRAAAS